MKQMDLHIRWLAAWCLLMLVAAILPAHAAWHECNSQGMFPGLYGSEVLANLTSFRSNLLSEISPSFNPEAPNALKGFDRFKPVSPFIECPPNRLMNPYGDKYRFCDLSRLSAPCVIYSIGPPGDYSFEKDIIDQTKCEVHTFDCTTDGKSIHDKRHKFHKWCISSSGKPNHKTLLEITLALGHLRGIDAARIDLEGAEPGLLAHFKHNTPLPRQIGIEIHMRPLPPEDTAILQPAARHPGELGLMFMHMAGLGYGVTHRGDNLGGQTGCCSTFSFLHVERVWAHGAARAHSRYSSQQPGTAAAGSSGAAAPAAAAAAAPEPPRVKRLVVTLSSFPGRAEYANPTVYSIMHGKRKPDALYFWVAVNVSRFDPNDKEMNSQKQIPGEAKSLQDQFPGVVKVQAAPKDYGPATKLLPTLQVETDPETVIVTVDDDTFYHPDTVYELEQEMIRRPDHVVVRSCEVTHKDPTKDPPRKGWREWKLTEGVCRGFMTAYASAAYRRKFLDDLVFKQELGPVGCLHHDDMWFSGHLWIRNVPIWVLNPAGRAWPPLYHRPKNRMSISWHPEADAKGWQCLDYFGWMDDDEIRKKLLGDREPYKPYS